jgi:hypothetical protein
VVVIVILLASGGSDNNKNTPVADTTTTPTTTPTETTAPTTTPTTPTTAAAPTKTSPAPAAAGGTSAAKGKPAVRSVQCDPIFGNGTPHAVTSSAKDGDPADCGEAHSVLLTALNDQASTVGDWHCTSNPDPQTLVSCTSSTGGRTISAAQ